MQQNLRANVTHKQENWPALLKMDEFAGNSNHSETTGLSPFFSNYGFDPRFDYDLDGPTDFSSDEQHAHDTAAYFSISMKFSELLRGQHRYKKGAYIRRTPAPRISEGDLVWLRAPNIRTERPS
jgi:hypothetical protein